MRTDHSAWNKGRLLGQKPPLKPKEIWSLRIRLQLAQKTRDLALFNLALDSKLRGCDLISLRVRDLYKGSTIASRAIVMQRKTCGLCSSKSQKLPASPWLPGYRQLSCDLRATCSPRPSTGDAPFTTAVQPDREGLGRFSWSRSGQVRYALAAQNEGHADLQAHKEHSRHPTAARAHKVGEHRALSRNRGRRRARDLGADRNLGRFRPEAVLSRVSPADLNSSALAGRSRLKRR